MSFAPASVRLRSTTVYPAFAATSATPEPMIPEPTMPICLLDGSSEATLDPFAAPPGAGMVEVTHQ